MAQQRLYGSSLPGVLRLLLLAALLLGIVTMHTLGHPGGGHGGSAGHGSHGSHGSYGSRMVAADHHAAAVPTAHAPLAVEPAGGGMDPMTVCLAVLAGWTLVLLIAGPLLRRRGDAAAEVRARLLRAVRALPPPGGGRILLSRLSVLRQ
ncbi:DUF6153 family protein [Streptomyces sp. CBMA123]|uniref:DUF6153 family protein n=1 Tax=Streptomyces sp. CBMA123 TaxID=1896313 RepID=UPI001661F8E9|nr:DUF6153 family protein [Streptomyces sp. CBMA123]MBD0693839.1 hypothetical protein [Streptomyces sp. CBMA123]